MLDFTLTTATPADGVVLVTLAGDLDVYTAPQLRDALVGQVNQARCRQVLDLSGVRRIDSTGLGVIVGGRARVLMHGGELRLVVPYEAANVAQALTITGLAKTIPVYVAASEALAAFTAQVEPDAPVAIAAEPRKALRRLMLNEDEVRFLYALAGRDLSDCVLDAIGGGIAGPHGEHRAAALSALAKLSDAVLDTEDAGKRP